MGKTRYNCSIVFSPDGERILMCRRMKDPFEGKLNLVGGKREEGESAIEGAYRELYEE
ncbi:MAG: NUDIX hydrolase, partial [Lachnospiraceae bacterium]|nr:NUDIX hydrolase [Lachnospiraceae bacterium]